MDLEHLFTTAKPFLFHEDTADATLSPNPSQVAPTPRTAPAQPTARRQGHSPPHALLYRSPWRRYSLIGVFEGFEGAADHASQYGYNSHHVFHDRTRSSAVWKDHRDALYIICPHPNPIAEPRVNQDYIIGTPGSGRFHLKYADTISRIKTQAKFQTVREAYACLAVSKNLSRACKRIFEPAKERWEWQFYDGSRYVIQGRKPMSRTRWTNREDR